MLYGVAIVVHVLTAVLGIGLVGAIPLTARSARRSSGELVGSGALLGTLLRAVQVGLLAMFLTGVLLDLSVAGAFHRAGWFRASILVFGILAFSLARARAALRRGSAPGGVRRDALERVERWGWAMCASVALLTTLMQTKPLS